MDHPEGRNRRLAAIKIADAEGVDAVSMRRIAAEMSYGTASLYRYITIEDELLDLRWIRFSLHIRCIGRQGTVGWIC